jgi:uroporphyrin-III C-methyltransferase/precorrin-2 dehydrogenase/sirohydrochlorin ferrochelatase
MDFLPVFLDIKGAKVLIDGGNTGAARRAERALSAGAHVTICDPAPEEEVTRMDGADRLTIYRRATEADDLAGCKVVYGTSEDDHRDAELRAWADEYGILCNIADRPEYCDFITPSIVDRSPILVAISTSGVAPVIGRILKARLEANLPAAYGKLAGFLGGFRHLIEAKLTNGRARRHFWESMIDGPVADLFLQSRQADAKALVEADLETASSEAASGVGEVYLVGGGPGNPDLLTFGALRLMQRCDVVLYDRLIGPEILSLVRRDARRIYVGKRKNDHTMKQEDITATLVRLAQEGNRVLRLKGGDPFIFGRGGEEIEGLAAANIPFQVVPGVTAAAGCGAYAGIPLTHRDHAQTAMFVTAHGKDGVLNLDWDVLARPGQTVAVYMGLGSLQTLTEGLLRHNVAGSLDVAVVENGTLDSQNVVTGTIETIVENVEEAGIKGPAIIIIGTVVQLRDKLNWRHREMPDHMLSLTAQNQF